MNFELTPKDLEKKALEQGKEFGHDGAEINPRIIEQGTFFQEGDSMELLEQQNKAFNAIVVAQSELLPREQELISEYLDVLHEIEIRKTSLENNRRKLEDEENINITDALPKHGLKITQEPSFQGHYAKKIKQTEEKLQRLETQLQEITDQIQSKESTRDFLELYKQKIALAVSDQHPNLN